MSILIKGMEMPSCCDDCWALDEYGDYPVCRITSEQRGYNFRIREKRMDNCPLVPVPPHGRLIDADDTENIILVMNDNGIGFKRIIAPIIIEAEIDDEDKTM